MFPHRAHHLSSLPTLKSILEYVNQLVQPRPPQTSVINHQFTNPSVIEKTGEHTYRLITKSVLSSLSNSSLPSLLNSTVAAPASRPASMSSTLSPTMMSGIALFAIGRPSLEISEDEMRPQACAMCKMPAGEGLGGRKSRVMMGEKAEMWPGRWVERRWVTGVLRARRLVAPSGLIAVFLSK